MWDIIIRLLNVEKAAEKLAALFPRNLRRLREREDVLQNPFCSSVRMCSDSTQPATQSFKTRVNILFSTLVTVNER